IVDWDLYIFLEKNSNNVPPGAPSSKTLFCSPLHVYLDCYPGRTERNAVYDPTQKPPRIQ
ncbi:hypothetical protein LCGC14_2714560, partial [marine sediment metagenome]